MPDDKSWDFLFNDNIENLEVDSTGFCVESNGYGYRNPDGSGIYYLDDGGWIEIEADGSSNYYGSDGGWGYRNPDGSGAYYGDDGSWSEIESDGSGSYYGSNGWGYRNSDGSGTYYGDDGSWSETGTDGSVFYCGADGSAGYRSADGRRHYGPDDTYGDDGSLYGNSRSGSSGGVAGPAEIAREIAEEKRTKSEEAMRQKRAGSAGEQGGDRKTEKENERKQRKKRLKALLFHKKNLPLEFSTSDLIGYSKDYVADRVKEAGFINYRTEPFKDIYVGSIRYVGQVQWIIIDGHYSLKKGTMVPYDAEIIIQYHEKKEFGFPYSSQQMINRDVGELVRELTDIGFTEIHAVPMNDLTTGWLKKDRSVHQVLIQGEKVITEGMDIEYDRVITIQYHSFKNR